jgi:hypothetical protein
MSKMNELSIDYDAYEDYVESERMELRLEGAEEMRKEIIRALEQRIAKAWTSDEKLALQTAVVIAEQATI